MPLGLAALLAGCGATAAAHSGRSPLVARRVLEPAGSATRETLRAPFTGSAAQTLKVRTRAGRTGFSDSLAITDAAGKTIFQLPHVGWAGVLEFGPAHPPLIVTRSDAGGCGSGGCNYAAYTWVPAVRRFEEVQVPTNMGPLGPVGYTWDPSQKRFSPVSGSAVPKNTLFGFGALTRRGITLTERLYDLNQNYARQRYVYVAGPGAGALRAEGGPSYGPTTLQGPYPQTPLLVEEDLINAIALGLPQQAQALLAAPAHQAKLFRSDRPMLSPYGEPIYDETSFDPAAAQSGGETQLELWQVQGSGTAMTLHSFTARLRFVRVGGNWKVQALGLSPIRLQVRTVGQVLAALRTDPAFQPYLGQQVTVDAPMPASATSWGVGLPNGSSILIDAGQTGASIAARYADAGPRGIAAAGVVAASIRAGREVVVALSQPFAKSAQSRSLLDVYQSRDGGTAWSGPIALTMPGADSAARIYLAAANERDIWMLVGGEPGAGQEAWYLYRTTDGGMRWARLPQPSSAFLYGDLRAVSLQFPTASEGWITSFASIISSSTSIGILHTTDGGVKWQTASIQFSPHWNTLAIHGPVRTGPQDWMISLTDEDPGSQAARTYLTTNDGASWSLLASTGS